MMKQEFPLDKETLLEVLNRLNLGAYVTDLERRIIIWNRKAEEVTGYRAADVVGTRCWDNILQHIDKEGHQLCTTRMCPLFRAMRLGAENDEPILVYARTASGGRVAVSVNAAPLTDADGRIVGGIETFRDETSHIIDMEFAGKIQRHLLPRRLPGGNGIEFTARYFPRDLVGGDFYDVIEIEPGRFGLLLADVRGHGVSAALYTVWLKSLIANFTDRALEATSMITALNRSLSRFVVAESFATGLYAVVDGKNMTFTYSNAGHPPPLHYSTAEGKVAELESHGLPLGISADEEYAQSTVYLAPGDIVFCYTDGLAEVETAGGRMLTVVELSDMLAQEAGGGFAQLPDRIYRRVLEESRNIALADDCTMVAVHAGG